MFTCSAWYDVMVAGPRELLPAAVLVCPRLEVPRLESYYQNNRIRQAHAHDVYQAAAMVEKAASVPRGILRVRVEGEAQVGALQPRSACRPILFSSAATALLLMPARHSLTRQSPWCWRCPSRCACWSWP